jgi:hypothetical protein
MPSIMIWLFKPLPGHETPGYENKKPPCEQGGYLTIACHMNKLFDFNSL